MWDLLPNRDTLLLANKVGRLDGFGTRMMLEPVIYEVNKAGRTVWTLRTSNHMDEFGFTPAQLKLIRSGKAADYLHFNDREVLGPNHWAKSGDARFAPDNILISSRNANFIAIISRKTGKIVWRVGPDFALQGYREGPSAHKVPFKLDHFSG